jgi:hypothetical protein
MKVYRSHKTVLFSADAKEWKAQRAIVEFEKTQREREALLAEGKRVRAARSKGGLEAAKTKRVDNAVRDDRIVEHAVKAINRGDATPRTVSQYLVDKERAAGLKVSRIRIILRKARVR